MSTDHFSSFFSLLSRHMVHQRGRPAHPLPFVPPPPVSRTLDPNAPPAVSVGRSAQVRTRSAGCSGGGGRVTRTGSAASPRMQLSQDHAEELGAILFVALDLILGEMGGGVKWG